MTTVLLAIVCIALFAVTVALIFHPFYEDGLIGRIALGLIAFSCALFIMQMMQGVRFEILPEEWIFLIGVLGFFVRHIYRFLVFRRTGRGSWKDEEKIGSH